MADPMGMAPLVFLSNPRDIRAVATAPAKDLHPGAGGAVMAPLFGDSAFVLREEDEHSHRRQVIMPAFQRAAVSEHAETINDVATAAVTSWPVGTVISLTPRLHKLTLKVMLAIAIGSTDGARDELERRMLDMLSVMATTLLQVPSLRHMPGWRGAWQSFVRRRHAVDEMIARVIHRRRSGDLARGDLLDMLLAAHNTDGSEMSDREIRDNLVSVIIAGHETTAATLAWAFQLLAHHPPVQARLIDEIDDGHSDAYMTATVQEILRHRPTFLSYHRETLLSRSRSATGPIVLLRNWSAAPI